MSDSERAVTARGRDAVSAGGEVDAFLERLRASPVPAREGRGRLLFALDATASRQPTWDSACRHQAEMFRETAALGGLDVQLLFYRGFGECKASKWHRDPATLARLMTSVQCLGGQTQIARVLDHAAAETRAARVNAVVFVGDAVEEEVDGLCHQAGALGLLGLPLFLFHEGRDPAVRRCFEQMARLSGGACCSFDAGSAAELRDLLAAVAVYAAGGAPALSDFSRRRGGAALRLIGRMPG